MKTHRNIPFFVPHAGCPHCCVFCSQTKITGQSADKDIETELSELKTLLENSGAGEGVDSRIAFFGGSFTAIERNRMESLLSLAYEYIQKGTASGIRISTRPDYINEEILELLKKYLVTDIELGIQSTDDEVLRISERGHSASDSFKAAKMVVDGGFTLCGQMMVGLPGATPESELKTARDIVKMSAKEARIYPTVVFDNTKLCDMTRNDEYTPLSLEESVSRSAVCYRVFLEAGINILRVGLHSSEELVSAPYGATHPAIGELVKSRVYTDMIIERAGNCRGKTVEVFIRHSDISMLTGNNNAGIKRIKEQTGAADVRWIPDKLDRFEIKVNVKKFWRI